MGYTEYVTDPRHTPSSRRILMAKTDDLPTAAAASGWLALLTLLANLKKKTPPGQPAVACPETLPQHVKDKCKELVDAL